MSKFEPDSTTEEPFSDDVGLTGAEDLECKPRRPLWLRILRGFGITVGALLLVVAVLGVLLYNCGGMSGSAVPGTLEAYNRMVASGQAPAIRARFVIPIPGCLCHSKDPVLTAQHTRRHMNECAQCHNTNPAYMEAGVL